MLEYRIKNANNKFALEKCRESVESSYASAQYQSGQCYQLFLFIDYYG